MMKLSTLIAVLSAVAVSIGSVRAVSAYQEWKEGLVRSGIKQIVSAEQFTVPGSSKKLKLDTATYEEAGVIVASALSKRDICEQQLSQIRSVLQYGY